MAMALIVTPRTDYRGQRLEMMPEGAADGAAADGGRAPSPAEMVASERQTG